MTFIGCEQTLSWLKKKLLTTGVGYCVWKDPRWPIGFEKAVGHVLEEFEWKLFVGELSNMARKISTTQFYQFSNGQLLNLG